MSKEPSAWVRAITLTLCFIECLLFAGNLSSWSILVFVLKQDGIFAFLCEGTEDIINKTDTNMNVSYIGDILPQTTKGVQEDTAFSGDNLSRVPNGTTYLQGFWDNPTDSVICPEQDRLLSMAFTLGIVVDGIMSIPLGWLQDKHGLRLTRSIGSVLAVSSYLLLGAAGPAGLSWLIFPGCICLGLSCHMVIMTNCHVCGLAGRHASKVVSLFNGGINADSSFLLIKVCGLAGRHASKVVSLYNGGVNANFPFLLIKLGVEVGLSRLHGMGILTGLWSIVLVTTFFLLPAKHVINAYNLKMEQELEEPDSNTEQKDKEDLDAYIQNAASRRSSLVNGVSPGDMAMFVVQEDNQIDTSILEGMGTNCQRENQGPAEGKTISECNGHTNLAFSSDDKMDSGNTAGTDLKDPPGDKGNQDPDPSATTKHSKPPGLLRASLLSPTYLLYLFWFSVLFLRMSWFLNTYNTWLTLRVGGDLEKVSFYTNLFGYFKFGSILVAPLAGIYMDYRRRPMAAKQKSGHLRRVMSAVPSLTITTLLSLVLSVSVLLDSESAIYMTLIAAEVFRAFLFATAVALLESVFSPLVYGKLFGVQYTVGAAVNFLMYPLTYWTESSVDGFTQANTLLLIAVGTTIIFPVYIAISYFRLKCKPDPSNGPDQPAESTKQAASQPSAQYKDNSTPHFSSAMAKPPKSDISSHYSSGHLKRSISDETPLSSLNSVSEQPITNTDKSDSFNFETKL